MFRNVGEFNAVYFRASSIEVNKANDNVNIEVSPPLIHSAPVGSTLKVTMAADYLYDLFVRHARSYLIALFFCDLTVWPCAINAKVRVRCVCRAF